MNNFAKRTTPTANATYKRIYHACITLCLMLFLAACSKADPQINAVFSVQPEQGKTSTVFTFDASGSSQDADFTETVTYSWDFGDGNSGTGKVVTHRYNSAGDYKVVLTFKQGTSTDTAERTINVAAVDSKARIIHTVLDAGKVNVLYNGNIDPNATDGAFSGDGVTVIESVGYGAVSDYLPVSGASFGFAIAAEGTNSPIVAQTTKTVNSEKDTNYTTVVLGTYDAEDETPIEFVTFADIPAPSDKNTFALSILHATPGVGDVNIYLLGGSLGNDISTAQPVSVSYKVPTPALTLPLPSNNEPYRILATTGKDNAVVFDSGFLFNDALLGGTSYTALIVPETSKASRSDVKVMFFPHDSSPAVSVSNVNNSDAGSNDTINNATALGTLYLGRDLKSIASIDAQRDIDIYQFSTNESAKVTATIKSATYGSDLDSILKLHDQTGKVLISNDDANEDTSDSQLTMLVPAGTYYLSVANFDLLKYSSQMFYDLDLSAVEITGEYNYGASAGTIHGDSNSDTIDEFTGNLLLLSMTKSDSQAVDMPVIVNIDSPGGKTLQVVYENTLNNVKQIVLENLAIAPSSLSTNSSDNNISSVEFGSSDFYNAVENNSLTSLTAGRFTFHFPGKSLTRTVNSNDMLPVPTINKVTAQGGNAVVNFTPVAGANHKVDVFARNSAAFGSNTGDISPVAVELNRPTVENDTFIGTVTASKGGVLTFPLTATQPNLSQYIYYTE